MSNNSSTILPKTVSQLRVGDYVRVRNRNAYSGLQPSSYWLGRITNIFMHAGAELERRYGVTPVAGHGTHRAEHGDIVPANEEDILKTQIYNGPSELPAEASRLFGGPGNRNTKESQALPLMPVIHGLKVGGIASFDMENTDKAAAESMRSSVLYLCSGESPTLGLPPIRITSRIRLHSGSLHMYIRRLEDPIEHVRVSDL